MLHALFFVLLLTNAPADVRMPAHVMAWVYAGNPNTTVTRLKTGPVQRLLPVLEEAGALPTEPTPVLWTWPDNAGTTPPVSRWTAANVAPGGKPLSEEAHYRALTEQAPHADLLFYGDVQAYYGVMVQEPGGARWAQLLRRLGLDTVQNFAGFATLRDARSVDADMDITVPAEHHGLLAAAGPAVAPQWPAAVPKTALRFATASLLPNEAWNVLEIALAGMWPLEYSLGRAQLGALEDELGKRWVDDALGAAPRLWTVYQVQSKKGATDTVVHAPVKDSAVAGQLLSGLSEAVGQVVQGCTSERGKMLGSKTLTVRCRGERGIAVYMAFRPDAWIVASSSAALEAHVRAHGRTGAWSGDSSAAQAFGFSDDAIAKSSWSLTPQPRGYHVALQSRARRP